MGQITTNNINLRLDKNLQEKKDQSPVKTLNYIKPFESIDSPLQSSFKLKWNDSVWRNQVF